jgi:non-specific serine/threonine protein kinase
MELHAGDQLGHYRLLGQVGEGGMGVVWKAHDTRLGRAVAIKLLRESIAADPEGLERFAQEARALATLHHPAIVTIHSVEEVEGRRFFTMELIEGTTLAQHVPESGLPLDMFFDLAGQLADAVSAAHEQGVAHRDLKPGNVLVTPSGNVKVLDFGIARILRGTDQAGIPAPTRTATRDSDVLGTPAFMAPEQLLGRPVDHRADIFSLGAILYFMLTGREAFHGDTAAQVFASLLRDEPPPVEALRPDTPEPVTALIARCLRKDPGGRFQTAQQLCEALAAAHATVPEDRPSPVRSVAVLPFDDLSAEKDQDYLCEGIAEEILLALTRIAGLRVASRSAAFLARATIPDRRDLGMRLGVEALLEGTVRKSGQRLRISVELTDVAGGYNLWTERYDRELQDIFAVEDDIAGRVAEVLRGTLSRHERQAIHQRPTPQVRAYDLYLRGRKFFYQYSRKGMEFALQMYRGALEIDPSYARAHAGIAHCHAWMYLYAGRHDEDCAGAEAASGHAVELAPDSADAHAARGLALSLRGADQEATAEFETALRLNPELFDAHYFYARACFARGQLEDAVRLWERASALRPEDYQSPLLVAQAYEHLGRPGEAERTRRRGARIAAEHLKLHPDDVRAHYMLANGLAALGHRDEALGSVRQALALEPDEPMLLYNIGCIYSRLGRPDDAFDCLERAVANGLRQKEWLAQDTDLDPLRGTERFERLMAGLANAHA